MVWPVPGLAIVDSFKKIRSSLPREARRPSLQEMLHPTPLGARIPEDSRAQRSNTQDVGESHRVGPMSTDGELDQSMEIPGTQSTIPPVRQLNTLLCFRPVHMMACRWLGTNLCPPELRIRWLKCKGSLVGLRTKASGTHVKSFRNLIPPFFSLYGFLRHTWHRFSLLRRNK